MKQEWKAKDPTNGNSIRARPYDSFSKEVGKGVLFHVSGDINFTLASVLVPYDKALKLYRRLGERLDEAAPDEAEVVG